jgi:hypothetical protein
MSTLDFGPAVKSTACCPAVTSTIVAVQATPQDAADRTDFYESAVAEIVGMICAKFRAEGRRSFAIGRRAYELAQWQRGNFPSFDVDDFNVLMRRIREGVRDHLPIKAESIRVAEWVRCHVLRELVRAVIADHADSLTMSEYQIIVGRALSFSTKDLEGDLNLGWLDMIRGVAYDRTAGRRVSRADYESRVVATVRRIADSRSALSPVARAAQVTSEAAKARKAARVKANEDITTSLSDGLSGGHITAVGVLSILETVAKSHGIPLPSAIGFDPARCTDADCDMLASTMFQARRYAEMVRLRDRLSKMVEAVDKARASALGQPATLSLKTA